MSGQVKSIKKYLKELQQSIQTITQSNLMPTDEIIVPKDVHSNYQRFILGLDILAGNSGDMFLLFVLDVERASLRFGVRCDCYALSMQAGYMDKAQKYTEKAFLQIQKLKC